MADRPPRSPRPAALPTWAPERPGPRRDLDGDATSVHSFYTDWLRFSGVGHEDVLVTTTVRRNEARPGSRPPRGPPSNTPILVTGSTGGPGREVARRLARSGAHVIIHGRNVLPRRSRVLRRGAASGHRDSRGTTLPLIVESAPARIVNVTSRLQIPVDFDDITYAKDFADIPAYGRK